MVFKLERGNLNNSLYKIKKYGVKIENYSIFFIKIRAWFEKLFTVYRPVNLPGGKPAVEFFTIFYWPVM